MKKFLTLWLSLMVSSAAIAEIEWRTNLPEAIAESKDKQMPVLAFFYADWCGPCQHFKEEVLTQEKVIEFFNNEFIPVKINVDKEKEITENYNIYGVPSLLVLRRESGEEVDRMYGAEADFLMETLTDIKRNGRTISEMEEDYRDHPTAYPIKEKLLGKYRTQGLGDKASIMLGRIQTEHPEQFALSAAKFHSWVAYAYRTGRQYAAAIPFFQRTIELASDQEEPLKGEAFQAITSCYLALGKYEEARQNLLTGIEKLPTNLELRYYLLHIALSKGVDDVVIRIGEEGLQIQESPIFMANYRYVLAMAHEMTNNLTRALELAEEAVSLAPDRDYLIEYRDHLKKKIDDQN